MNIETLKIRFGILIAFCLTQSLSGCRSERDQVVRTIDQEEIEARDSQSERLGRKANFSNQEKFVDLVSRWRKVADKETEGYSIRKIGGVDASPLVEVVGTDPSVQPRGVTGFRSRMKLAPQVFHRISANLSCEDLDSGQAIVIFRNAELEPLTKSILSRFDGTLKSKGYQWDLLPPLNADSFDITIGLNQSAGVIRVEKCELERVALEPIDIKDWFVTLSGSEQPAIAGEKGEREFVLNLDDTRGLLPGEEVTAEWSGIKEKNSHLLHEVIAVSDKKTKLVAEIPSRGRSRSFLRDPVSFRVRNTTNAAITEPVRIAVKLDFCRYVNIKSKPKFFLRSMGRKMQISANVDFSSTNGGPEAIRVFLKRGSEEHSQIRLAVVDGYGNPVLGFGEDVELSWVDRFGVKIDGTIISGSDFREGCYYGEIQNPGDFIKPDSFQWVQASTKGLIGKSNPIRVVGDEIDVLFGDLHVHCEISRDGAGNAEYAYAYGKQIAGLDFAALTDHTPRGELWERTVKVGNQFNEPGKFTTLIGYEYSHLRLGHRNMYFKSGGSPHPALIKENTGMLWDWYDSRNAEVLVVPHHPNTVSGAVSDRDGEPVWGPVDWSAINHRYQRLVELCQIRGSFEAPGGPNESLRIEAEDAGASVQTALELGHVLGFFGSTDTHNGRAGDGPARCAVFAGSNTRESIWNALRSRHCYATSGSQIFVKFSMRGLRMGSVALEQLERGELIKGSLTVAGCDRIKRVELLHNNDLVFTDEPEDWVFDEELVLPSKGIREWIYARITQEDGEMAWTSPIWFGGNPSEK